MTILSALAAVIQAAVLSMLIALHVLQPRYSPLSNAVSDYGIGPTAGIFRLYLWLGIGAIVLLAGLTHAVTHPAFPAAVPLCLALLVPARLGIMAFPTDPAGRQLSRTGMLHYLFAIAGFALVYMTIDKATPVLVAAPEPALPPALWVGLKWISAATLAAVVLTMVRPLRVVFGLAERAFITTYSLWFLLIALWLSAGPSG